MEWISFTLDNKKKSALEKELLPALIKQYGFLIDMSGQTWEAYFESNGIDSYRCIFCSDSALLMKFVKEIAENSCKIFSIPDLTKMQHFGPEDLNMGQFKTQ